LEEKAEVYCNQPFLGSGFIVHKIVTNYAFFEILSIVLNNKITN